MISEIQRQRALFKNWKSTFLLSKTHPLGEPILGVGRSGATVLVRNRTSDQDTYREIFDDPGYASTIELVRDLAEGSKVVDLGANVGFFTLRSLLENEGLEVIAYEPMPDNAECWRTNLALNGLSDRATLHVAAVDAAPGPSKTFYTNSGHSSASFHYGYGEETSVQVEGVNEALAGIDGKIALLKIDIEGAEFEVIPAINPSNWKRIDAIAIEIHGRENLDGEDLKKAILAQGFRLADDHPLCQLFIR